MAAPEKAEQGKEKGTKFSFRAPFLCRVQEFREEKEGEKKNKSRGGSSDKKRGDQHLVVTQPWSYGVA